MSQLRLQKRDDPLAINQDPAADAATGSSAGEAARRSGGEARRRTTRRAAPAKTSPPSKTSATTRRRRSTPAAKTTTSQRTYDEDRLEQTGWRLYESLLADVRIRAEELSAAGIPTSAAALAAATLHSHLPKTIEEGTEMMRAFRQASAGRRRRGVS